MSLKGFWKWSLRGLLLIVLLGAAGIAWVEYEMRRGRGTYIEAVDAAQFQTISGPIAIINAQVLAPDGNSMLADQIVIIDDGQIQAVGPDISIPSDCHVLDATGQFLIPGLVDSHVHFEHTPNDALLYVANGITQVHEMGGSQFHLNLAKDINNGRLGPDMYVASKKIYNRSGFKRHFANWTRKQINVATPEQATQLVERLADDGFDAVKLSHAVTPDSYWALDAACKAHGLDLVGHIPNSVTFDDFWNASQKEVAHVEELTKALDREFGGYNVDTAEAFVAYVKERAPEVAAKLAEHQISVQTTVWLMESIPKQKLELANFIREVELAYVNPALVEGTRLRTGWLPGYNGYEGDAHQASQAVRTWIKAYWGTHVETIRIMTQALHEHDVLLLAGTDANAPSVVPGFSLHDELITLSSYGLSNADSLRSATLNPASWRDQKAGKIEPGYLANLVLLRQNPLDDMAHIKTIEAVVLKGQLLEREQLDAMLSAVKAANDRSRTVAIEEYL